MVHLTTDLWTLKYILQNGFVIDLFIYMPKNTTERSKNINKTELLGAGKSLQLDKIISK